MQVRLPFITPLAARAKSTDKDSRLTNCLAELDAERSFVTKRPGLSVHADLGAGCGQGMIAVNGVLYALRDGTLVENAAAEAVANPASWELKTLQMFPDATGFEASILLSFNGNLYLIGGWKQVGATSIQLSTVYRSPDGVTWTQIAETTAIGVISSGTWGHAGCVYNGKMWVVKRVDVSPYPMEVWSSEDGITWTKTSAGAPWGNYISGGQILTFDNKMYVIGGYQGVAPTGVLDDVWSSTDGATWTLVTGAAGFGGRYDHAAMVFNNKLWVVGGRNGAGTLQDIWSSPDGATWTLVSTGGALTRLTRATSEAVGGKLWIVGGVDVSTAQNVITSTDGATWTVSASGATFKRFLAASAVHDGRFFLAGGRFTSTFSDIVNTIYAAGKTTPAATNYAVPDASNCAVFGLNQSKGGAYVFFKTAAKAYFLTVATSTVTTITDVDYPTSTVPGVVYLDGYFFVMTPNGRIHNSDLENPASWNSLNYIDAETEPDGGVALAKQMNYVVALGQWTTELFYDAANINASPLSRVSNGMIKIGCASGNSVVELDDMLIFMSQGESAGRSITVMVGLTPKTISDRNIDKILNGDDLAGVYAYGFKLAGHTLYLLTLKTSNITLVYDFTSGIWSVWSSLTARDPITVSSLTSAENIATAVTSVAHGFADGDHVTIAGAAPAGYNGTVNITHVNATTFTYPVTGPLANATGTITAVGYTESYFKYLAYASTAGRDLIQHETDGKIYQIKPDAYDDAGAPINAKIRTPIFDGGTSAKKFFAKVEVLGDKASTTLLCRYSDDDYVTNSTYRRITLTGQRCAIRRLGSARRRNFEFRHTSSTALRLEAMELDVST